MLFDSNIIIYSSLPEYEIARKFISKQLINASWITYLEVMGYHKLKPNEKLYFEDIFSKTNLIPITWQLIEDSSQLRRDYKLSLGDSIIAATALEHRLTLATNNTDDFKKIKGLKLINPLH